MKRITMTPSPAWTSSGDSPASKAAREAGKQPIDVIELSGAHELNGVGNLWEKGYALAKLDERLTGAADDK